MFFPIWLDKSFRNDSGKDGLDIRKDFKDVLGFMYSMYMLKDRVSTNRRLGTGIPSL